MIVHFIHSLLRHSLLFPSSVILCCSLLFPSDLIHFLSVFCHLPTRQRHSHSGLSDLYADTMDSRHLQEDLPANDHSHDEHTQHDYILTEDTLVKISLLTDMLLQPLCEQYVSIGAGAVDVRRRLLATEEKLEAVMGDFTDVCEDGEKMREILDETRRESAREGREREREWGDFKKETEQLRARMIEMERELVRAKLARDKGAGGPGACQTTAGGVVPAQVEVRGEAGGGNAAVAGKIEVVVEASGEEQREKNKEDSVEAGSLGAIAEVSEEETARSVESPRAVI